MADLKFSGYRCRMRLLAASEECLFLSQMIHQTLPNIQFQTAFDFFADFVVSDKTFELELKFVLGVGGEFLVNWLSAN